MISPELQPRYSITTIQSIPAGFLVVFSALLPGCACVASCVGAFSCRDGDAATRDFPQLLELHESVGFQILRLEVLVKRNRRRERLAITSPHQESLVVAATTWTVLLECVTCSSREDAVVRVLVASRFNLSMNSCKGASSCKRCCLCRNRSTRKLQVLECGQTRLCNRLIFVVGQEFPSSFSLPP